MGDSLGANMLACLGWVRQRLRGADVQRALCSVHGYRGSPDAHAVLGRLGLDARFQGGCRHRRGKTLWCRRANYQTTGQKLGGIDRNAISRSAWDSSAAMLLDQVRVASGYVLCTRHWLLLQRHRGEPYAS